MPRESPDGSREDTAIEAEQADIEKDQVAALIQNDIRLSAEFRGRSMVQD